VKQAPCFHIRSSSDAPAVIAQGHLWLLCRAARLCVRRCSHVHGYVLPAAAQFVSVHVAQDLQAVPQAKTQGPSGLGFKVR
jgi:hypothetical protein